MEGLNQSGKHPRLGNYEKADLENLVHLQCDEIGRLKKIVEQMTEVIERLDYPRRSSARSCTCDASMMM